MISSHAKVFRKLKQYQALSDSKISEQESIADFFLHQQWSDKQGWKATLNNFRLIVQPTILFWMIVPWLDIFPNRSLFTRFSQANCCHESILFLFS